MDETTNNSWSNWFQGVAAGMASKAADAAYVRPYDIQELEIRALGSEGYYSEGQPGTSNRAQAMGGISPTVLLLGGVALLAVFLMKD